MKAVFLFVLFGIAVLGTVIGAQQQPKIDLPFRQRQVLPKQEPIHIDKFRIATAEEAESRLKADELVIGVSFGDESRAYPLNMISGPTRELLNDKVGDRDIAVTWCSLCFSAVVFDRDTSNGKIELGIAGSLWNDNMVMYDTKTKSLWSQIRGEAMEGKLKGTKLRRVASDVVTWRAWKNEHPDTTAVIFSRTSDEFNQVAIINRSAPVLAVASENSSHAWLHSSLRESPVVNDEWEDQLLLVVRLDDTGAARVYSRRLDNRELTFVYHDGVVIDEQTQSVWDSRTGTAISGPLQGSQLERLPTAVASKTKWQQFFPEIDPL